MMCGVAMINCGIRTFLFVENEFRGRLMSFRRPMKLIPLPAQMVVVGLRHLLMPVQICGNGRSLVAACLCVSVRSGILIL